MRVEAGSVAGKPVHFAVSADWQRPKPAQPAQASWLSFLGELSWFGPATTVLGAAIYLARRHVVTGRGDRRGASRLACYVFVVSAAEWMLSAHNPGERFPNRAFLAAAGAPVVSWILYMALEPYARRYWPHSLVSWSRLLAGRLRDPHLGRDVLFGCLLGVAFAVFEILQAVIPAWTDLPPRPPEDAGQLIMGVRHAAAQFFHVQADLAGGLIGAFLGLLLLRILLRRQWLAIGVFLLLLLGNFVLERSWTSNNWLTLVLEWVTIIGRGVVIVISIVRFGLLGLVVMGFASSLTTTFPSTFDFSAWYASAAISAPLFVAALALYGCWAALARQPLVKDVALTR
jgi:hypothetical protein